MKYALALLAILAILIACIPMTSQPAQAYLVGSWLPCTVDNATTTSAALDLGDDYYYLNLYTPTVTTGTVTIQVARELTGTYAADGQTAIGLTSTTGGFLFNLNFGRIPVYQDRHRRNTGWWRSGILGKRLAAIKGIYGIR